MAKTHTKFTCQQCGFVSPKYLGRCPECDEWNTFVETAVSTQSKNFNLKNKRVTIETKPVILSDIKLQSKERIKTNISEIDHVLGGGLVSGQVVLLAGEPGVGKSTLLLQVAKELSSKLNTHKRILYTSGEESPEQINLRAIRLGFNSSDKKMLSLYPETNVESLLDKLAEGKHSLAIVDSIQTMWSQSLTGAPGSVGQVRECSYRLIQDAKRLKIPIILVGQVTKEGSIAGPKVLEHLVDTVLYMEGSRFEETRIIRVTKNRFGPTDEVGVFDMKEDGLRQVTNPSGSFITNRSKSIPGQAVVVMLEGTRPLLIEVQALAAPSDLKSPRRVGNGVSFNRLTMLCAIVSKHLHLPLERFDIYVNVSGGMSISEPAGDLGVALAIYSSFKNKPLPDKSVAIGELSLLGEVQEVSRLNKRIKEAKRMEYKQIITHKTTNHISGFTGLLNI